MSAITQQTVGAPTALDGCECSECSGIRAVSLPVAAADVAATLTAVEAMRAEPLLVLTQREAALQDRIDALTSSLADANERAGQMSRDYWAARNKYDTLAETAREIAIREHHNDRWCRDGLNEALREMGLPEYESTYAVTVTVEYSVTVRSAASEDNARSIVRQAISDADFPGDGEDVEFDSARVTSLYADRSDDE